MMSTMTRWLAAAVLAVAAVPALAAPAAATPPTRVQVTFSGVVADQGQACGFPLSWAFTGDAAITRFFNQDGRLVRISVQVRESGSVTNTATSEVVELARTAFVERVLFVEDGTIVIQDNGLSVRVTGPDDFLLDVGRFSVQLRPNELLQSSGMHPIREINPYSVSDPALLGAFCDLFA